MKLIVNGEVAQIPAGGGGAGASIPTGGIIMWSGSTVPDGWALCNGENGTPDLRGRFVLGVSDSHQMGEVGGEEEVTLTVEQLPSHAHRYSAIYGLRNMTRPEYTGSNLSQAPDGARTADTNLSGGNQPHTNMPPYYTLAYIMKL